MDKMNKKTQMCRMVSDNMLTHVLNYADPEWQTRT